jgi:hypothetical protein
MSHYVSDPDARPVRITTYPRRPRLHLRLARRTVAVRLARRDEVRYGDFFATEAVGSGAA